MFAGTGFTQTQFGVLSALPMDDQDDLPRRLVDVDDDVLTRVRTNCWRKRMVTSVFFHAASRSSVMPVRSGITGVRVIVGVVLAAGPSHATPRRHNCPRTRASTVANKRRSGSFRLQ